MQTPFGENNITITTEVPDGSVFEPSYLSCMLTLKVPVTAIDALQHFETG